MDLDLVALMPGVFRSWIPFCMAVKSSTACSSWRSSLKYHCFSKSWGFCQMSAGAISSSRFGARFPLVFRHE